MCVAECESALLHTFCLCLSRRLRFECLLSFSSSSEYKDTDTDTDTHTPTHRVKFRITRSTLFIQPNQRPPSSIKPLTPYPDNTITSHPTLSKQQHIQFSQSSTFSPSSSLSSSPSNHTCPEKCVSTQPFSTAAATSTATLASVASTSIATVPVHRIERVRLFGRLLPSLCLAARPVAVFALEVGSGKAAVAKGGMKKTGKRLIRGQRLVGKKRRGRRNLKGRIGGGKGGLPWVEMVRE